MANTLLQVFSVIMQILMDTFIVIKLSEYFEKTKYSFKRIVLTFAVISIGLIVNAVFQPYPFLKPIISVLPIAILLIFHYKMNISKTALILFSLLLILAITEVISVYMCVIIFKAEPQVLLQSTFKTFVTVTLQHLLIFASTLLLLYILRKKSKLLDEFRNITLKQIKVFLIAIAIYVFPQMLIFVINTYDYPISFLMLNSIQFIVICVFLFCYLRNTINFEKTQADLITTQLHNTAMTSMVDGVRTMKHDYNNDVQALNRIYIN